MGLKWSKRNRNELMFIHDRNAFSVTLTFIVKYDFLPKVPEFDGMEYPEGFGQKSKGIIGEVLDALRESVNPFLSSYLRQFLRNRLLAKRKHVLNHQTTAALE